MKKVIFTLMFSVVTFLGNGQSFLSKYPKLTDKNLQEFFTDWKNYSDSISCSNVLKDSVLSYVVNQELSIFVLENNNPNRMTSQYCVFPQTIEVERYYLDVDTARAKLEQGFPLFIPDMESDQFMIESVIPVIPHKGLYLTDNIRRYCQKYVDGSPVKRDKNAKAQKDNILKLKKYIPVDFGHWGSHWWFTSFPVITGICYANNLIAVMRRTSWCTGDVIWYVKVNDRFVRQSEPVCEWIE